MTFKGEKKEKMKITMISMHESFEKTLDEFFELNEKEEQ